MIPEQNTIGYFGANIVKGLVSVLQKKQICSYCEKKLDTSAVILHAIDTIKMMEYNALINKTRRKG